MVETLEGGKSLKSRTLTWVLVVTLIIVSSSLASAQGLKVIRYGSSDPVGTLVGFMNLYQQRFLAEYGYILDINWLTSDLVNKAFVARQIDVIDAGAMAGPLMRQGGVDVKLIMIRSAKSQYVLAANKKIQSAKDLEGGSVGISAPGAISDIYSRGIILASGGDPAKVSFVRIGGTSARMGALLAGRIDAAPLFIDSALILEAEGDDKFHILARAGDYLPLAFEDALWTTAEYARTHPDEIVALIKSRIKMLRWIYENEEEFLQSASVATGVDYDVLARTWEEYKAINMWPANGETSVESLIYTMEVSYEADAIDEIIPLEEWVDLTYLERAQKEIAEEMGY